MNVLIIFFAIFIPIFIAFFWFMTYQNRKEGKEKEPLYIKIISSFAVALIITLVFMFFIFIIFGTASFTTVIFNLDIDIKTILFISVTIVAYSIIVDHLIFTAVKHIAGENLLLIFSMFVIRLIIFISICSLYALTFNITIIISIVLNLLFTAIDYININKKEE
ncbi:hypothetical protein [Oceanobacillus neutriphilus]|uniref:Uncharacterized protein n=1 Tax=Oceanobacillus neutriphilus TaxID=531815 RepID=A0ABQ2P2S0_9BACI|nr:hypothetical protein [Oceanobacillus neutriphilus]GGP16875.1 hypothetical protein GCM10011346_50580 [Oceanobacillus neutriphilus]